MPPPEVADSAREVMGRSAGRDRARSVLALPLPDAPMTRIRRTAPSFGETPTAAPTFDAEAEANQAVLSLVPTDAVDLAVTDFDQIRLQLGVPDLTGADPKRLRDAFWRDAETEAPLLLGGMLRDVDDAARERVRVVAGRRRLGGALRWARRRWLGAQDPRRPADGRHHPRRRRRRRTAGGCRGARRGSPGGPQRGGRRQRQLGGRARARSAGRYAGLLDVRDP